MIFPTRLERFISFDVINSAVYNIGNNLVFQRQWCFIKEFMKNLEKLIDKALDICREDDYNEVSPPLFQRRLMVDWDTGELVFRELEKLGIVKNARIIDKGTEDENIIGTVDKVKLKKLFMN